MRKLTGEWFLQRSLNNGLKLWSISWSENITMFQPSHYSSLAGVSGKRIKLVVMAKIFWAWLKRRLLVEIWSLSSHNRGSSSPLLTDASRLPSRSPNRLVWIELLWQESPEHCATLAGLGKFQPKSWHLAAGKIFHPTGHRQWSRPGARYFCVPQRDIVPPPC